MTIGTSLVYQTLTGLTAGEPLNTLFTGLLIESTVFIRFLGIPVFLMPYASSVIPIILSIMLASKVEKGLKKFIPDVVKTFLIAFFYFISSCSTNFYYYWAYRNLGR